MSPPAIASQSDRSPLPVLGVTVQSVVDLEKGLETSLRLYSLLMYELGVFFRKKTINAIHTRGV
jgi:hypothetical protein